MLRIVGIFALSAVACYALVLLPFILRRIFSPSDGNQYPIPVARIAPENFNPEREAIWAMVTLLVLVVSIVALYQLM